VRLIENVFTVLGTFFVSFSGIAIGIGPVGDYHCGQRGRLQTIEPDGPTLENVGIGK
jgi:hypothetical protein